MFKILKQKKIILLIGLMIIVSFSITSVAIFLIYKNAQKDLYNRLTDIVNREKISVTVWHDTYKENENEIIEHLNRIRKNNSKIGENGEITIARQIGDSIEFIISKKSNQKPFRISIHDKNAEPMRKALHYESGVMKGRDYSGNEVYASYTYIKDIHWGFVSKIPVSEFNKPFIFSIHLVFILSLLLIGICSYIFLRITNPLMNRLLENENNLKKAKEKAVENEQKFRLLFESAITSNSIFDKNCKLIMQNHVSQNELGKGEFGGLGLSAIEIFGEKIGKTVTERMLRVFKTGIPETFETNFGLQTGKKWFRSTYQPVKNSNNEIICIQVISEDISAIKNSEIEIKKFQKAIDSSKTAILITDIDGVIEYANPYFSNLSGYKPKEYIGKKTNILKSGFHNSDFYQNLWDTIKSGETWEGELFNVKKNGEYFWEYTIISPLKDEANQITNFVAIKTDITESKKVKFDLIQAKENAEQSNRLKSSFLANISHEIRTPMNGILGFTDLLKSPNLSTERQKEYIGIIKQSGNRLLAIINDLISIAKIESGQIDFYFSEIQINTELDYIHSFFTPEAQEKKLELILNYPLTNKQPIFTDKEKVLAILSNLINNAIKFTITGTIEFGYKVKNDVLEFYVKDTGIGIQKNKFNDIFERFTQADLSITRGHEGAGLGLSIAKAYVDILDGTIWLESEIDKGSCFYFTIPINTKTIIKSDTKIETDSIINNSPILIVDDDPFSLKYLTNVLQDHFSSIIQAKSGKEAIEICEQYKDIKLVLMDIEMPEMNGNLASIEIKKNRPELPIIAQTAYALEQDIEKYSNSFDKYITKPINLQELLQTIHSCLNEN